MSRGFVSGQRARGLCVVAVAAGLWQGGTAAARAQGVPIMEAQATALAKADQELTSGDLSPDRRWVVYAQAPTTNTRHLWVRPAAGGPAVQLTTGAYHDDRPVFAPSGDRIYFVSNRPSRPGSRGSFFMSMTFDARTGTGGMPRQVSLDPVDFNANVIPRALSPDGRWLVHLCCERSVIRTIPSAGGEARDVPVAGRPIHVVWSADAASVIYTSVDTTTQLRHRVRAFVDGRRAETIRSASASTAFGGLPLPDGRFALRLPPRAGSAAARIAVINDSASLQRPVVQFQLPSGFQLSGIAADGRSLIGSSSDAGAVVTEVPIAGGPARRLTDGTDFPWPAGWTDRGEVVMGLDRMRADSAYYVATRSHRHALPAGVLLGSATAGWATYELPAEPGRRALHAIELATGRTVTLTTDLVARTRGAGGQYGIDGGDFIFLERAGDRFRLIAWRPDRAPRIVREFPSGTRPDAVAGSQVLWTEPAGPAGTAIVIADGPAGEPRRVYTYSGRREDIAFSRDGTRLALGVDGAIHILRLDPDLSLAGEPQIIPVPFEYWYESLWLPDGSGITTLAQIRGEQDPDVVLIRLADPTRLINLTRDDPNPVWGFLLSPDGTHIVYPSEVTHGSTLWRIDIGPILDAVKRGR